MLWFVQNLLTRFDDHQVLFRDGNVAYLLQRTALLLGFGVAALPTATRGPDDLPWSRLVGEAYELAWLVVEHLVATYGQDRVLALHRDLGARPGTDPEQALADALDDVLGLTPAQLLADWRASLRRTLS